MLSHLLHLRGIDSVVIEARSRQYVEERVRAGLPSNRTPSICSIERNAWAPGSSKKASLNHGIELRFGINGHAAIASTSRSLTGMAAPVTIYPSIASPPISSTRLKPQGSRDCCSWKQPT